MPVRVEREENRFVARVEGEEATLRYMREGDVLEILSTYTPPSLRGREIAARLTEAAIAFARAEGLRVRPTCSYTRTFFHQHPELGQMLEDCA